MHLHVHVLIVIDININQPQFLGSHRTSMNTANWRKHDMISKQQVHRLVSTYDNMMEYSFTVIVITFIWRWVGCTNRQSSLLWTRNWELYSNPCAVRMQLGMQSKEVPLELLKKAPHWGMCFYFGWSMQDCTNKFINGT